MTETNEPPLQKPGVGVEEPLLVQSSNRMRARRVAGERCTQRPGHCVSKASS